ncbi:MAG: DUF551 domain-containing protein [Desulfobacula sp.]|uniref:DUF6475 domain-containing protein n=1 Tax=Desulfobacula sp. TaxID=2593537 RepID=UPI0039B8C032|nr:DUF551 domain-containing protein [Desulfobacula sp.]
MLKDGFSKGKVNKMQNDFIKEFATLYLATYSIYKRPRDSDPNPVVYELFYEAVKKFGYDAVKAAFSVHIQSPDNGQWIPKPADIVRIIEGTSKDNALVAWSKLKKTISAVGSYETVVFNDPIIHAVVQDMGGWIFLCSTTEKELPFKKNEFQSRYYDYKSKSDVPVYPAKLYGTHESENLQKGYLEHIPEPNLIGNPVKAEEVLRLGSNKPSLMITKGENKGLKKIGLNIGDVSCNLFNTKGGNMTWIRVEDKLPEEGQRVIYYFEHTGIDIGRYSKVKYLKEFIGSDKVIYGDCFHGNGGWLIDDVTHWMPVPDKPGKVK